jgi:O-acetyl-ADP-ribose deacetylase (regulator of RNase III)
MIEEIWGNVLNVEKGIIVHGVNCKGVMGSGIAKEVKERYPELYRVYKSYCSGISANYLLGDILPYHVNPDKIIINAFTQLHYGGDECRYVSYDAIEQCFSKINRFCAHLHRLPICFPKIGAGLGGGNWDIISTIIDKTLDDKFEKILFIL